jgi:hypothetical protein
LSAFDVVRALRQRDLGGLADEVLELVVLGDEVGLRVDLDRNPASAVDGDADEALGRGAARLLGRRGKALGLERVDRRLEVAAGVVERLLAVHHPGAGALAEVLHVGGCVSHCLVLLEYSPAPGEIGPAL